MKFCLILSCTSSNWEDETFGSFVKLRRWDCSSFIESHLIASAFKNASASALAASASALTASAFALAASASALATSALSASASTSALNASASALATSASALAASALVFSLSFISWYLFNSDIFSNSQSRSLLLLFWPSMFPFEPFCSGYIDWVDTTGGFENGSFRLVIGGGLGVGNGGNWSTGGV